jgi:FtsH-binding integral membrane protein
MELPLAEKQMFVILVACFHTGSRQNMIAKTFLALVGFLYLGLAVWCSFAPAVTSDKVGFDLQPGSGQSEFLVIYGGLELGLASIFLLPLVRADCLRSSLLACVLIHASLVVFRTVSLFLYSDISSMTYKLAIGEWVILILAVVCMFYSATRPDMLRNA